MLDLPVRSESGAPISGAAAMFAEDQGALGDGVRRPRSLGLAGRVLVITIGFVLLAMAMFYVSRLAAFRETWLHNKLASAQTVLEAFGAAGAQEVPPELSQKLIASVGVKSIAISTPYGRRVLVGPGEAPAPAETVNLDQETFVDSVSAAFRTLFAKPGTVIHVSDGAMVDEARVAVTLDETPLIAALWRVSHTILDIALMIAAVVTCVLWIALWQMVLRPVRRLTTKIIAFGENPQDLSR